MKLYAQIGLRYHNDEDSCWTTIYAGVDMSIPIDVLMHPATCWVLTIRSECGTVDRVLIERASYQELHDYLCGGI